MNRSRRNKYFFGLGTIGRDMGYCLMGNYLLVFMTEVLDLPDNTMWWITGVMVGLRIFDALNDPVTGMLVDNTNTRWGKFKPWILTGAILSAVLLTLAFSDTGLLPMQYVVFYALIYIGWDLLGGVNDTAYWSMLTSVSLRQRERESIGAFARICANIGTFIVIIGTIPITSALTLATGSRRTAWSVYALAVSLMMVLFQLFTLLGVREYRGLFKKEDKISFRRIYRLLSGNDQLLAVSVSMALFTVGFYVSTGLGVYYFKYVYGEEHMFAFFAAVLGVAQLVSLSAFPWVSRRFGRQKMYTGAVYAMIAGYTIFFFAQPVLWLITAAGVLIFTGAGCIQLLLLMLVADSVEYGQWKNGKRSASLTFSVQPIANTIGGAVGSGILGSTLILSGINSASSAADMTAGGMLVLKSAMLLLPMVCVTTGYAIYKRKYRINTELHEQILSELRERGDLLAEEPGKHI